MVWWKVLARSPSCRPNYKSSALSERHAWASYDIDTGGCTYWWSNLSIDHAVADKNTKSDRPEVIEPRIQQQIDHIKANAASAELAHTKMTRSGVLYNQARKPVELNKIESQDRLVSSYYAPAHISLHNLPPVSTINQQHTSELSGVYPQKGPFQQPHTRLQPPDKQISEAF